MARRKKGVELTIVEVFPEIAPEERARRIERFEDTLAKANNVDGYVGCKYFPDKERGEVYISERSQGSQQLKEEN